MVRAAADVLAAGDVLGGRYRLERLVAAEHALPGTGLWQAVDLVLERPVAVRTVVDGGPAARGALLAAAGRASTAHDPRIAATYDADLHDPGGDAGPVAYLVREWVEGRSLRRYLLEGGLDPAVFYVVLRRGADAVAALHASGGWHGRVHPDNLVVTADDRVRLTDPGTGCALAVALSAPSAGPDGVADGPPELPRAVLDDLGLGPRPPDPGADPALLVRAHRYDTLDLGRVLYAATTGTWVGGAWRGMPEAPGDGQRPWTPRQVRAAVPRDIDAVVEDILLPAAGYPATLQDAASVAAALRSNEVDPVPAAYERRRRRRLHPLAVLGAVLLTLALLAGLGFSLGTRLGRVPRADSGLPTITTPAPSAGARTTVGAALALSSVVAFDPPPGDGHENDDQTPLAHDGSTATAWQTERYNTATFGNIKPGVGLLVDLGAARHVSQVQAALVGTGETVQLLAADTRADTLSGFALVTSGSGGNTVTLTANATHRYWLLWITKLPRASGGYRGGFAELVFRS